MPENIILNESNIPVSFRSESLRNLILNGSSNATFDSSRRTRERELRRPLGRSLAYVTNFLGFSVSVVDIALGLEIDQIPIGTFAYGIDIHPRGNRVYVTNFPFGTLTVISIPGHNVIQVIDLSAGLFNAAGSTDVQVSPNGRFIYVTNSFTNNISVVNAFTNTVVVEIPLQGSPQQIAITPDGTLAYVTLTDLDLVAVVDLTVNSVLKYIGVGDAPVGIDISPIFPVGLTANSGSDNLTPFNTELAESASDTIAVGNSPVDVVFHPRNSFAYATNQLSNTVSAVDVFLRSQLFTIPVGNGPTGIDINETTQFIVVANALDNTVTLIDRRTLATETVAVGLVPVYVKILDRRFKEPDCGCPKKHKSQPKSC